MRIPRFPVCIPSRGRPRGTATPALLRDAGVPFRLFVEPQEADEYRQEWGAESVHVLPFRDRGTVVPSRNECKKVTAGEGAPFHWQIDDDFTKIERVGPDGKWAKAHVGEAMADIEDEVRKYKNIGIAGVRSRVFAWTVKRDDPDFVFNRMAYGMVLVNNNFPIWWRGRHNEDADYSLQVLSLDQCTMLTMRIGFVTAPCGSNAGGNSETVYRDDGRVQGIRELQRYWPGLGIKLVRRFGQPRHSLGHVWRKFTTKPEPV